MDIGAWLRDAPNDATLQRLLDQGIHILIVVVVALVVVRLGAAFIGGIVRALMTREASEGTAQELTAAEIRKRSNTIEGFADNLLRFLVFAIALVMILSELNLDIGPAIAGLGVVGIAVGFGAQRIVRDYLNGTFILVENQYSVGDVVRVSGVSGTVVDFTLRRTTLRDIDGTVHTVPNGEITVTSNLTRGWARVVEDVEIARGADLQLAMEIVDSIGSELSTDPEWSPRILERLRADRVAQLGEFGSTLRVVGTVRASEQWAVAGEFRKRLQAAFAERGIEIRSQRHATA